MKDDNFLFPLEPVQQVCGLTSPCTSDASPTSSSDEEEDVRFYELYMHDDPIPELLVPPTVSHLDHEDPRGTTIVAVLPPPDSRKGSTQDDPPSKSEIFVDSVCLTCRISFTKRPTRCPNCGKPVVINERN